MSGGTTYRPGRRRGRGNEDMVPTAPKVRVSCRLSLAQEHWQFLEEFVPPDGCVQDVIRRLIYEAFNTVRGDDEAAEGAADGEQSSE